MNELAVKQGTVPTYTTEYLAAKEELVSIKRELLARGARRRPKTNKRETG